MVFECYSALELLFKKQIWRQDDVLRGDQRNAEFVQDLLSVNCFKEGDRGDVVEAFSGKAVYVGHDASHIGLLQVIKRCSFFQNSPQNEVIVFHMAFLVSRIRIAIKDFGSGATVDRTDFERDRVAEFRAVVGQDEGKQHTEAVETEALFQLVEHVDDRLRGVSLTEEQPHHPAGVELHGQQSFSARTPDDAVHLHHGKIRIFVPERLKICISPSDAAFLVDFVIHGLSSARLHHAGTRHVAAFRAKQPGVDVTIHCFFSNRELILLRFEDVMDGLSFLNPAVNLFAEELSFFLRDIRSNS